MTMTRKARGVLLAIGTATFFALTQGAAFAQTPQPAPPPAHLIIPPPYVDPINGTSVEQLVDMALEQAPEIQAARTEIEVARGDLRQAALRPNPTISGGRQEEVGGTDNQAMVNLEVPLDLFRRAGRLRTAQRVVEAVSLSVADRERLLAAAVREQAGRVLAEGRSLAVADELLALNRRTRELLQARVAEGASPPLELSLVDVEVRRIEAQQTLQVGQLEAALIQLKALVGLSPEAPLALREQLEAIVRTTAGDPATVAATTELDVTVAEERPDVREAAARVRVAEARVEQRRREGRFDIGLYGTYMRMDAGFPQRGFDAQGNLERVRGLFHNVAVGAMVMVPLRNRNQGSIAAAEAERRGAERLQASRELAARAEVAAATVRDRQARRAVELYGSGAREIARRNLEVVREAYELGRSPLFDVLAEQRRYLEVESAYTEALSEAFQARTALRRAVGEVR